MQCGSKIASTYADAVAIAVTEDEVAPDAVPDRPFGLTPEQKEIVPVHDAEEIPGIRCPGR